MALSADLSARLNEVARLGADDVAGWMNLFAHEAGEILKLAEDAEVLHAVKQLVLEHNVPVAVLRTLLANPTVTKLQGMTTRPLHAEPAG